MPNVGYVEMMDMCLFGCCYCHDGDDGLLFLCTIVHLFRETLSGLCFAGMLIHFRSGKFALDISNF